MSKTPYELRYDTLRLARDHLLGAYDAQAARLPFISEHQRDAYFTQLIYPDLSTIIETAAQLKTFVDNGLVPDAPKKTPAEDMENIKRIIDENLDSPDLYKALNEEMEIKRKAYSEMKAEEAIKSVASSYTPSQQRFIEHLKVVYSALALITPQDIIPARDQYQRGVSLDASLIDFYYVWSQPITYYSGDGINMTAKLRDNGGSEISISGSGPKNSWNFKIFTEQSLHEPVVFVENLQPQWNFDMMVSWFGVQANELKDLVADIILARET